MTNSFSILQQYFQHIVVSSLVTSFILKLYFFNVPDSFFDIFDLEAAHCKTRQTLGHELVCLKIYFRNVGNESKLNFTKGDDLLICILHKKRCRLQRYTIEVIHASTLFKFVSFTAPIEA